MPPECEYRVEMAVPEKFYCRHTLVHARDNIVTTEFCNSCSSYSVACGHPRPMPASRDVPVTGEPTVLQMFWNVASSVAAFVGDGMQGADKEVYAARLAVCDTCEQRSGNRCLKCGCLLSLKASGRIFECPLGKWPDSAANTQDSASGTPS